MAEPSQYESLLAVVLLEHTVAAVLAGPVLAGLHLAEELIGATGLVSAAPGLAFPRLDGHNILLFPGLW